MSSRILKIVAALVVALLPIPTVDAWQTLVTIRGVVRDSSGGAIPGATGRAVNEGGEASVEAVSGADGAYEVVVPPGAYRLQVALDGFETAVQRVVILAGQTPS